MSPSRAVDKAVWPTTGQLRSDIDSRTGSKVPGCDPAAAPLGTDDEAAGATPTGEAIEAARRIETSAPRSRPENRKGGGAAWILIAVVIALGAAAVAFLFAI